MMRVIFLFLLSCSLFSSQLDLQVRAPNAILMNADTGVILFEKEAYVPCSPASTTKIGTVLYVLEKNFDLSQQLTVSKEALKPRPIEGRDKLPAYWLDSDGTMMHIRLGEILSLDTLLHGLMLISGNDAANVVAERLGGTVPQFMDSLNEYLRSIGCKNTHFSNPHGLTHHEHWSTAYDLAWMTKRALQIPKFREIVSTLSYMVPKTNKQPSFELKLTNPLLKPKHRHYYSKAIGVKTGYTMAAGQNLVAAAEHEGRTLIAVLLGGNQRGDRFEDAKKMFEKAFAEKKIVRRLMGPETVFKREVIGGTTGLKAALSKGVSISFFPSEEPNCKAALHWKLTAAPIRKGQKVGEVHILDERGDLIQKEDLMALEEVKQTLLHSLKKLFR